MHTLTMLTQHDKLPVGFDERVAGIVRGCCGFCQDGPHRWCLERVREVVTSIIAVEIGH